MCPNPRALSSCRILVLALLIGLPAVQAGEPPIHFKADRSHARLKAGTTILEGQVEITQGKSRIRADRAILTQQKGKLQQVTLTGQPAHWQMTPEKGAAMQAEALEIRYQPRTDIIELIGSAVITQGEQRAQGEYFKLNRKTGELLGGDVNGGQGRVELVLPAPPHPDEEKQPDAPH